MTQVYILLEHEQAAYDSQSTEVVGVYSKVESAMAFAEDDGAKRPWRYFDAEWKSGSFSDDKWWTILCHAVEP